MLNPQFLLDVAPKLAVDLFAGGGGASTGIEQAIGRHVDIAINHDPDAIGMHEANHPQTRHYNADVWHIDPVTVTAGRAVGLLHASPDCTDHSQAKGGQPRRQEIRSLAWVVHRWAGRVRPDVITLENVEQMLRWSNLVAKRDKATGRVVTLDVTTDPQTHRKRYRVADPGERVPRRNQFLVADTKRLGTQWRRFVAGLRALGYAVQWRVICNADLGAHSTRTRLYMIARRDGLPIVWPAKTHAKKATGRIKRHRAAAECIDWSIPGRSIFDRPKPLADATMRRIAYGLRKFVLESPEPYIVNNMTHNAPRSVSDPITPALTGGHKMLLAPTLVQVGYGERNGQAPRALDLHEALGTVVAGGNKFGLAAATLIQMGHGQGSGPTKRRSNGANDVTGSLGTVTASGGHGLMAAYMVQANGGYNATPARDLRRPVSAVTASGSQQQLITAHLTAPRHHSVGRDVREPVATIAAGGEHHAPVQYSLSQDDEAGALRCAAFLVNYYGNGTALDVREPMATITTKDRMALTTVWLHGQSWVIVDITLRMLTPRELYNAQDFPARYIIDRTAAGKPLTKTAQVRMCGNSVCPLSMRLIVTANYQDVSATKARVAA